MREYTTYAHIGVFIFVYDDHASLLVFMLSLLEKNDLTSLQACS